MHPIEFKICIVAGNGSRVVVTHQIFLTNNTDNIYMIMHMHIIKNFKVFLAIFLNSLHLFSKCINEMIS